ncbi:MAG: MATE family efflux transporter [Christensenellaceae bacterium]|nr:MATE family efflux transporter [Christensenellaceae bacterium]
MTTTRNLTEGKVSKQLLAFFFPMLLTNLLQQIYSVADTAIVGKGLGDAALGAVGNLASLNVLIIGFATGMTHGFSVIIGRNYGAGNSKALRKSIALSIRLSVILTVLLTAASCLFLKPILLAIQTDPLILPDSLLYGHIVFGGLAATVAYNLCASILRALGDSRTPFIAIVISSALNILLDYFLIFVLRAGVEGVAITTIFSQVISVGICLTKMRGSGMLRLAKEEFEQDASMSLELLKNGIPLALMNCTIAVGNMIVQGYVNSCGVAYTSAYSVCGRYLGLFILPAMTAGNAVSSFVSQNSGAVRIDRIRESMRVCMVIALVFYALFGSVMVFLPRLLASFMLNEAETMNLAVQYMRICGALLFLVNFLFVFRNGVQGLGYPVIPMCSGILEMVLRIPAIMILLPRIGFSAIAYAEIAAWIGSLTINAATYAVVIRRKSRQLAATI